MTAVHQMKGFLQKFVVLDIDGVLLRGGSVIPGASQAVQRLAKHRIPFIFVTNGGGMLESVKATELSNKLEMPIRPSQVVVCHTPWRDLVGKYNDSRVLVLGGQPRCVEVAKSYGFTQAVSVDDIHRENVHIYPLRKPSIGNSKNVPHDKISSHSKKVKAVMVFHDPVDWGLEMQVLSDVLRPSHPLDTNTKMVNNTGSQQIPFYVSNDDLVYTTEHPVPRFTQGAFTTAFKQLYEAFHDKPLQIQYYGKPFPVQYEYAERVLHQERLRLEQIYTQQEHTTGTSAVERDSGKNVNNTHTRSSTIITTPADQIGANKATIESLPSAVYFGIGDNPKSDIRGANNAGAHWRSVLVRTGTFDDTSAANDAHDPADYVCDDVAKAVDLIIKYHEEEEEE